jgi:hypothetical protein
MKADDVTCQTMTTLFRVTYLMYFQWLKYRWAQLVGQVIRVWTMQLPATAASAAASLDFIQKTARAVGVLSTS